MEGVVESRKRESGEDAIADVMAVDGAFVRVWDVEVREEEVLSAVSAIPLFFWGGPSEISKNEIPTVFGDFVNTKIGYRSFLVVTW